ncbi:hypothetical protein GCM10011352_30470 [Marinobacterium zhoushanense]|uniref:Type II secretion system protein GspB C-terminal domain-containing protein n=1 Tax=Marinobacterium zhoushanense TaxID=1679163 RepID=A0ABQ1KMW2_9GAMM|nr:general secretion pathway protein GspB [Marinobacterium zhoushanense]GGC02174.1 hypothetical protein GCM10011352_30470 [Marinobacterium zhoushanense]
MSYILQALKESEAKRGANTSPEVEIQAPGSDIVAGSAVNKRISLGWWLGGAVLVSLVAGVVLIKLLPDALEAEDVGPQSIPAKQEQAEQRTVIDTDKSELVGVRLVLDAPEERTPPVAQADAEPPSSTKAAGPAKDFIRAPVQPGTEPVADQIQPDPYADLPYQRQLPAEIQRELPELRFSVHIYAESRESRLVKLGDRMMKEGQGVAPELRIEAIIPKGVVMRYREQLFKVPTR